VGTGIKVPMLNFIRTMGVAPDYDFEVIGNIYENSEKQDGE
jgi:hypothetical protein